MEKISEEKRIEEENRRIKEWEQKFDEEQQKKEEELIRRFYRNEENTRQSNKISEIDNQNTEQDTEEKK